MKCFTIALVSLMLGLPAWGAQVVLMTPVESSAGTAYELLTSNLDGTNRRQLTRDGKNKFLPHFSPDGTRLVYTRYGSGSFGQAGARSDIAILYLSSGREVVVTQTGEEEQPVWSADGTRIAWLSRNALKVMQTDGSGARTIASASGAPNDLRWSDPAWSSDDWIAFAVTQVDANGCLKTRIDKIRPDGSSRTQVTDGGSNCTVSGFEASGDAQPAFSADGKTLYVSRGFPRSPAGAASPLTERRIVAVSSGPWFAGKPETDLSLAAEPSCVEGLPKGSPDGKRLLVYRACYGPSAVNGIFVTDTTGSYRTQVAEGFGADWNPAGNFDARPDAEALEPLREGEMRYLAFQVFEGSSDPSIPFDKVVAYTPKEKIAAVVHDIVTTIGVTGSERAQLAFMLGPISFDHSDAEARQIIADGFAIALAEDVAVGFHLDDSMFWSQRGDLIGDPATVEWTDFSGTLSTGLNLDWAQAPARMCFNSPRIQAEVTRRARSVIGDEIANQVAGLRALGKEHLFAGVIAGWESHMGQDVRTRDRVGFHALANRGYGPGRPPADVGEEIASIVAEFIGLWTNGLAQAGVDPARIYTHVAFLTRRQFASLPVPAGVTYEQLVDAAPSSQRPSVAFVANARPGFSTYPVAGVFEQIQEERALRGQMGWASSEGSNLLPGSPVRESNLTMETYLARSFNHGATLVNLYGWGIGGAAMAETNPFQIMVQSGDSIEVYRRFLRQDFGGSRTRRRVPR